MTFDHEKLDVYRVSLEFVAWSYDLCRDLSGMDRHARDQLLRASQSIPLNIAEGNGKRSGPDRRRFLEIARGSAMECAAILDVLVVCGVVRAEDASIGKHLLYRIVSMLTKLAMVSVAEESADYLFEHENEHENEYEHEHEYEVVGESGHGGRLG